MSSLSSNISSTSDTFTSWKWDTSYFSLVEKAINMLTNNNTNTIIINKNILYDELDFKYKKKYLNKSISSTVENMLLGREKVLQNHNKKISIINDEEIEVTYAASTIISNGDVAGLVIIFDDESLIEEIDFKMCQIVSTFLGKYLED